MKPISVSRADFKHTVTSTYYIDKTSLISKMIKNEEQSILFCRPRRFGKTLNMSMLYYFFSNQEDSKELFQGLNISKDIIAMSHINKYPTIFLSLKDLGSTNDEFENFLKDKLIKLLRAFESQIQDDESLIELLSLREKGYQNNPIITYSKILNKLIDCLHSYYDEQVVILIDEYDNAVHHAVTNGYQDNVLNFLRAFLSPAVKDNNKVKLIAFTGILRITKESLFSGMNNLNVCDVLCQEYSEYFGLTEDEVKQLLEDFDQSDRYEEIKTWYNGYLFGETVIYNPWSTLNSVKNKSIDLYWKNTASEDLLNVAFKNSEDDIKLDIASLLDKKRIITDIDLNKKVEEQINGDIISLLLSSGYLKVTKKFSHKNFELDIVNFEIREVFEQIIKTYLLKELNIKTKTLKYFQDALQSRDLDELQNILTDEIAHINPRDKNNEGFYHGMIYFMLKQIQGIDYESQPHTGRGYAGIYIKFPNFKYLIEIKKCSTSLEVDAKFEEIKKQIIKNEYYNKLDNTDLLIGIVFDNKECHIKNLSDIIAITV